MVTYLGSDLLGLWTWPSNHLFEPSVCSDHLVLSCSSCDCLLVFYGQEDSCAFMVIIPTDLYFKGDRLETWNFLWEKIISRNLNSFFPSSASSMFPGSHWVSVTSKNSPFYGKDELKMISVSLGKLVCRTVRLLIHTEWESHLVFHGASPSFSSSSFSGHFMSSRGGCCSPDHHLFIWVSWLSALISILN